MRKNCLSLFFLCLAISAFTQIAPPGLTNKGGASWLAVGIKQQLNTNGSSLSSYVGVGRAGTSNRSNPFQNHVLFVGSLSYKKAFKSQFYISPAFSYRHQEIYENSLNNEKQEFRFAIGFGKVWKLDRLEFKSQFKQEFRKFYDASFRNWDESIQLRSRLKLSAKYQLTKNKKHHISTNVEFLFTTTEHIKPSIYWEKISYSDTRLSAFYSYSIPKPKPNLIFSVGYMIDLIGVKPVNMGNYISLDLVWKDPFHKN